MIHCRLNYLFLGLIWYLGVIWNWVIAIFFWFVINKIVNLININVLLACRFLVKIFFWSDKNHSKTNIYTIYVNTDMIKTLVGQLVAKWTNWPTLKNLRVLCFLHISNFRVREIKCPWFFYLMTKIWHSFFCYSCSLRNQK